MRVEIKTKLLPIEFIDTSHNSVVIMKVFSRLLYHLKVILNRNNVKQKKVHRIMMCMVLGL